MGVFVSPIFSQAAAKQLKTTMAGSLDPDDKAFLEALAVEDENRCTGSKSSTDTVLFQAGDPQSSHSNDMGFWLQAAGCKNKKRKKDYDSELGTPLPKKTKTPEKAMTFFTKR